jgi:hypothetical protein
MQLFISLLCGAAAMLCKEHGDTVLGVCMLYDVLILNRDNLLWYLIICVWLSTTSIIIKHRNYIIAILLISLRMRSVY